MMVAIARPPRRRPPPPSPSHSLYGLEKAVPPCSSPPGQPSLSVTGGPSRSPLSSPSDRDKPLPLSPRRNSSIYSDDSAGSGYTRIIQSYASPDEEDEAPLPVILQPQAYRDAVSALLSKRLSEAQSTNADPANSKSLEKTHLIPDLILTPDFSPLVSATDSRCAPSFADFSRHIRQRRHDAVSPMSSKISANYRMESPDHLSSPPPPPLPPLDTTPCYRPTSLEHERQHLSGRLSGRMSETVDEGLMPAPLDFNRISQQTAVRRSSGKLLRKNVSAEPVIRRLSQDSYSEDSFTIYNGAREVVKAMIKDKIRRRKEKHEEKKEREENNRVMSYTSQRPPRMSSREELPKRTFSWVSDGRASVQQGVDTLFRKLSVRGNGESERGRTRERGRREKQRAISTTPYQRYGAEIWYSKNKKKRAKRAAQTKSARKISFSKQPAMAGQHAQRNTAIPRAGHLVQALQNGRSQLIQVLDGQTHRLTRTGSERRREKLKKSIVLVGPHEQILNGKVDTWV